MRQLPISIFFPTGSYLPAFVHYWNRNATVHGLLYGASQCSEVSEVQEVQGVVKDLGVNRFASALMWVLGHVFGLEERCMPWNPNENDGSFLLNEIMRSGNFGHHDERIPKNMNYWKSFWFLNIYNLRLIRFDYWSWFWTPIMRLKGFVWRKINGYK